MRKHALAAAVPLLLAGLLLALSGGAHGAEQLQVSTAAGVYQGHFSPHVPEVGVFRGVGWAAPPVGDLRWRPPLPAPVFAGVRQADRNAPACWQARNSIDSLYARGELERSEDCLYLNVFSGAADSSAGLPVMVWFHGGGNTAGHGGALIFDGSRLAARGAVVVTANYRLGPFGFLAHPALTAESAHGSSGNYGILDQIQVLRWVQENIEAFGGDPSRVTIFGQSAGGGDVCLIMTSPLAEGLFHRVIGQSPSVCPRLANTLVDSGHERGAAFMEALDLSGSDAAVVERMRALEPERIVDNMATAGAGGSPIIDGWVLVDSPRAALASGAWNRVPVLVGSLADEYYGLQHASPDITGAELEAWLQDSFGAAAEEIAAAWNASTPLDTRKQISGDNGFIRTARNWARLVTARGDNAWVYFFTRHPPVFRLYVPAMPDLNDDGGQRSFGAYHSGELAYVFDNQHLVGLGWDEADRSLSTIIADYWVNFARNGDPNGPGLPNWPVYDPATDVVQILDSDIRTAVHPRKEAVDKLEALGGDLP